MPEEKKKLNPRVVMGVCSAVGFIGVAAVKVYSFGWDDVPVYWIFAGVLVMVVMGVFIWWQHTKGKKQDEERMDTAHARAEALARRRAAGTHSERAAGADQQAS